MTTARDIKSKIASVKNTQKITSAMQMVASSKMRKTQTRMQATRPYSEKILDVIAHLSIANPEYNHPYLMPRKINSVGYIIVTTDRGLCGALNTNVLRDTLKDLRKWQAENVEINLCLVGNKADAFFKHFGGNILAKGNRIEDEPKLKDLIGIVKVMLDYYSQNKIDALYICYNKFINTMKQEPIIRSLLPVALNAERVEHHHWDYIYEPDSKTLLDRLLRRYIEMGVYQAAVENVASEQAARMIAMMNATQNAKDMIDELLLDYNKVRQANITREITEIVGGASGARNF